MTATREVTRAEKMARGGCGAYALMNLGFSAENLPLNDNGGATVGEILKEIKKQGGKILGAYAPEMTARGFLNVYASLGDFLVCVQGPEGYGHAMALKDGALHNVNGTADWPILVVYEVDRTAALAKKAKKVAAMKKMKWAA